MHTSLELLHFSQTSHLLTAQTFHYFKYFELKVFCAHWNKKLWDGNVTQFEQKASACNFAKSNPPPWVFSRFLNCANATKSRKASTLLKLLLNETYLLARHWERHLNWYDHTDVVICSELFRFHRRESVLLNKTYSNQNVEEVP